MSQPKRSSPRAFLSIAILFEGGLGLVAWAIGRLSGYAVEAEWRWNVHDAGLGVLASLPMLFVALCCLRLPFAPFARIREVVDRVIYPLFGHAAWWELALLCAVAGWGEEYLFRGVIQANITRWAGPWVGLAAASVIFGLMHPLTAGYIALAALLGAYLGGLWLFSENLLSPMIAHGVYDLLAISILRYSRGTIGRGPTQM